MTQRSLRSRYFCPVIVIAVLLLSISCPSAEAASWKDLAAILQEAAGVPDMEGQPTEGQFLSTILRPVPGEERMILVYQRVLYDGARKPRSRQIINYTFDWKDLNTATVKIHPWQGQFIDEEFYLVSIQVNAELEFVPYSNLVEKRLKNGQVDITGSRGRIRSLVLGYFLDRDTAGRFAKALAEMLKET